MQNLKSLIISADPGATRTDCLYRELSVDDRLIIDVSCLTPHLECAIKKER